MNVLLTLLFVYNVYFTSEVGSCTFPNEWDGLWYDSRNTEVTLDQATSAVLSGWSVVAYSSTVTSWKCVEQLEDTYLLKSDQEVDVFTSLHWAYLCLKVTKVTDVSYRYTIMADEQVNAGEERVSVISIRRNATISGDCDPVSPPGAEEFHVLVKADNVSSTSIRQYFPEPLLAVLYKSAYVKTGQTCESDVILDICSNRTTLNRTECFTSSGQVFVHELHCITYVQVGDKYYVSVLDPQVTGSGQQRIKCLAATKLNNLVYISDNTGSCAKGQDPKDKQAKGNEALVMFAKVLCPFETVVSSTEEGSTDIGVIIGCVIAGVVFLGILIILVLCLRKKTRKKIFKCCCNKCKRKWQQKETSSQQRTLSSHNVKDTNEIQNNNNNNEERSCILVLDNLNDSKNDSSTEPKNDENVEGSILSECSSKSKPEKSTQFLSIENKTRTFIVGNLNDLNHNCTDKTQNIKNADESSSFENMKDSKRDIHDGGKSRTDREIEGTLHQSEASLSEILDSSEENFEFGKPPVDERGDVCFQNGLESVVTVNEFNEAGNGYTSVERSNSQSLSELSRQTTEEDMEELRRINRRVHLEKQLFQDSRMSFVPDMTSRERDYFEKSVFAKQNVEAEMYLNDNVSTDLANTSSTFSEADDFEYKTVSSVNLSNSSGSLATMSEGHDQLVNLNLKQLTHNTAHVNDKVYLKSNSPIKMHNRQNSMNQEGVVMEEYEFSLTDEQRSGLSMTMLSRTRNRLNATRTSPVTEEILQGPITSTRHTARITKRPRSAAKVSAFPIHESVSVSKPDILSGSVEPVLTRSMTNISRLRNTVRKQKIRNHDIEPKAPKMKFRWI